MNDSPASFEHYSLLLPSAEETSLLRACLLSDNAARAAWEDWRVRTECDFIGKHPSVRKIRPLLFEAHRRNNLKMDEASRRFLRLSYFNEELRRDIFERICRMVLEAFGRAQISVTVLKGAALAAQVYPPSLRHCHDIDLWLRDEDVGPAKNLLASLSFRTMPAGATGAHHSHRLVHRSELPVELHTRLFQRTGCNGIVDEIRRRCRSTTISGTTAQILAHEDNLLHVCAHAFFSNSRQSLRWVCDAWRIIERHRDLDWELLLHTAQRSHLTLSLVVMFTYLAETLGSTLPGNVLDRLARTQTDPVI